jgi:F-type H+-transporting ATPase subunit b
MKERLAPGLSGMQGGDSATGWRNSVTRQVLISIISCTAVCLFWITAAVASGGGSAEGKEGPNWFDFSWRLFNFLVMVGLLYWLLAKKAKEFFFERRDKIKIALAEAVTSREAAQKKFQEYSEKLDKATEEIDQISEMIKAQGLAEKERIINEARKAAGKMREDVQVRMEQEFTAASQHLRVEAVRLSAQMAGELLKRHVTAADHDAIVKDYIEKAVRQE